MKRRRGNNITIRELRKVINADHVLRTYNCARLERGFFFKKFFFDWFRFESDFALFTVALRLRQRRYTLNHWLLPSSFGWVERDNNECAVRAAVTRLFINGHARTEKPDE